MSSSGGGAPGSGGLGQSTPLVTINNKANLHHGVRSNVSAADHPLAAAPAPAAYTQPPPPPPPPPPRPTAAVLGGAPPPPPPPPPPTYQQQQHLPPPTQHNFTTPSSNTTNTSAAPAPAASSVPPPPPAPAATSTAPPSTIPSVVGTTVGTNAPAGNTSTMSMEDQVNYFLSGPSYRTMDEKKEPLLRPVPLRNESPFQCLRTLVERRAWGDVLQIATEILHGVSLPQYSTLYNHMVQNTSLPPSLATLPFPPTEENNKSLATLINETAEAMTLQCHAWLKLRRYADMQQEISKWKFASQNNNSNQDGNNINNNNNADPSSNSNNDQFNSWIPCNLHILAAETLHYTDDQPTNSIDELFLLRARIAGSNDKIRFQMSIDRALTNVFLRHKEFSLALKSLMRMEEQIPDLVLRDELPNIQKEHGLETQQVDDNNKAAKLLMGAYKSEILSVQGRILLQVGAIQEGSILFQRVKDCWTQTMTETNNSDAEEDPLFQIVQQHLAVQHMPAQLFMNDGLLAFSYPNYVQALECFKKATDHLRAIRKQPINAFRGVATTTTTEGEETKEQEEENALLLFPKYTKEDWMIGPPPDDNDATTPTPIGKRYGSLIGILPHHTLYNECINNMSICALYTCKLKDAVYLMESLIREDPTAFLTERIAFNLCTLYELGSDSGASVRKKKIIQLTAKRFFLHDIGPESFRLNQ